jgi:hypothetical protein
VLKPKVFKFLQETKLFVSLFHVHSKTGCSLLLVLFLKIPLGRNTNTIQIIENTVSDSYSADLIGPCTHAPSIQSLTLLLANGNLV